MKKSANVRRFTVVAKELLWVLITFKYNFVPFRNSSKKCTVVWYQHIINKWHIFYLRDIFINLVQSKRFVVVFTSFSLGSASRAYCINDDESHPYLTSRPVFYVPYCFSFPLYILVIFSPPQNFLLFLHIYKRHMSCVYWCNVTFYYYYYSLGRSSTKH